MASALIFSPARTSGRTLRFIHSGPRAAMGGHPIVWLLRLAFTPPLPWRAISRAFMMPQNGSVRAPPAAPRARPLGALDNPEDGMGRPPAILLGEAELQQAGGRSLAVELAR